MKRRITLLLLAAGAMLTSRSQVLFQENFTAPFQTGWVVENLSVSASTLTWFQPTNSSFPAYNGATNDFIACNFQQTQDANPATISSWLMTPTVNLQNGYVVSFYTRTTVNPNTYPDRLEVRMSSAGTASTAGNSYSTVGTFTNLLVTVNPSLTTTGYPATWTLYTATITGLGSPAVGRIGFRYFVPNSGTNGSMGDFIGVDAVSIVAPACAATVQSSTICTGSSATLMASGAAAGSTYNWLPGGQTTSSIVVTPGTTTSYTLQYTEPSGVCPEKTATVTVGNTLNVTISSTSPSVCAGGSATLTASGASQYGWLPGPVIGTPSIVVNPGSQSVYTVGGSAGTCTGSATYTLGIYPSATVSISGNNNYCSNGAPASVTFTGSGANSYTWSAGTNSGNGSTFPLNVPVPTAPTTHTMMVTGTDVNGCMDSDTFTLTASPKPTVTISGPTTTVCTNSSFVLTANGASSYAWTGGGTNNTLSANAGATASSMVFTVTGTTGACSSTSNFTQAVVVCNTTVGIAESGVYTETTIYPNPFTTEIRINTLDGSVVIYNALGQVVINQVIGTSGVVNTSNLPKGTYVVKAYNTSGEVVKTTRLVKN